MVKLIELCAQLNTGFNQFVDTGTDLNPFSTQLRYPSEYDIPSFTETEFAVKQAQKLIAFIAKQLSKPNTGQLKIFDLDQEDI